MLICRGRTIEGMKLDPAACYRALLARDERHDGRFFVCVETTGVFCRPVCPARPPKFENCKFVPTAAAAAEAGFRPCLRCKPEYSPDTELWQGTSATVSRGLRLIEEGALDQGDVEGLANRLGVGERHLRRLFRQHVGATPIVVAQTRRILLAKQLIHHTDLSMTDIALASGFNSVRRFNETFRKMYDRSPAQLRRKPADDRSQTSVIKLSLPYRPPYDWEAMLGFLSKRAIPGVERVSDQRYCRTIEMGDVVGTMEAQNLPDQTSLRVTVAIPRIDNLATIIARTRHLFDLRADPIAINRALFQDSDLAPLVHQRPGLRVPGAWDGFEIAIRAILGQQISVDAATNLAGKLVDSLGTPVPESLRKEQLTRTFPNPAAFRLDRVIALGIPHKRAEAIVTLAEATVRNPHLFAAKSSLDAAVQELRSLPGIGEWTAQYIAMRVLRESDAFLAGDVALQRILAAGETRPDSQQLLARAEAWRPWRAYATLHLWTSEAQTVPIKNGDQRDAITI
jgi:AraC family transcriptional regulator of adaptative response / DNA-3-methyladenine glycosylase II